MVSTDKDVRLLIADSDYSVRNIIRVALEESGWLSDEASDGIMALKLFRRRHYHLVVIDYDLAELDGRIVCRQMRKASSIPIIFISIHAEESERLAGFAIGGNDYVLKPFYPRELIARIGSLLSLSGHRLQLKKEIDSDGIIINLLSREVMVNGQQILLTPREYNLLLFFCQNPSRVYSREALLNCVWGEDFRGSDRTVDTHIKSLRGKIQPFQARVVTIWSVGYMYEPRNFGY